MLFLTKNESLVSKISSNQRILYLYISTYFPLEVLIIHYFRAF